MREELLTESEERRINEIYEEHAKYYEDKVRGDYRRSAIETGSTLLIVGIILCILNQPIGIIFILISLVAFLYSPEWLSCIKFLYEGESYLLIKHLRSITMKRDVNEHSFTDYLGKTLSPPSIKTFSMKHLRSIPPKSDLSKIPYEWARRRLNKDKENELIAIFKKVKERADHVAIDDSYKLQQTPWEFFRDHFFNWWITEKRKYEAKSKPSYSEEERWWKVSKLYDKTLKHFQEFDKAPRISGDLAVEFEDFLEENRDIIPVSKDKVMKLIEAWRKYKTEIALV